MVSSTRRTSICILLILGAVLCIHAQTPTQKVANASISGKVTIKDKPAVGVVIFAKDSGDGYSRPMRGHRARTDQTGSYRITNLSAGTYEISAIAPALVPGSGSDSIAVSEGEEVQDVNISLVPGGVITGKITDSDGEPVIGQQVIISAVDEGPGRLSTRVMQRLFMENITDDRGVYRAFGLPPGKYKVSVGDSSRGMRSSRELFKETFYPSVTDTAKATVIEVSEGSVTNNVDIVMGGTVVTYRVSGRVIDNETGRPIPNIKFGVGYTVQHDRNSMSRSSGSAGNVNANGEFRLENLMPGTYTIYTEPPQGSDAPSASVTFEVVDRDLDNLLITTMKGGSLSGVVVLDNESAPGMLSSLRICASVKSTEDAYANSPASAVGQDGSFRINGLRSGIAGLWICSGGDKRKQFHIVGVSRNGVPSDTVNVKAGEHVAGIRVTVKYVKLTGAIRGQLKVENGELPPHSQTHLVLWPLDENLEPKRQSSIPRPELDARGRFFVEGLPAGVYRLNVYVYVPLGPSGRTREVADKTEQVTVTDDTVTEVTLVIKPQTNPN